MIKIIVLALALTGCAIPTPRWGSRTKAVKRLPWPKDSATQMDALFYNGNLYEAPPMGWEKARWIFLSRGFI
jgi:hypothetical protein